jgi:TRAP-type C4-dicarboxylate transport system substrate-binding protein
MRSPLARLSAQGSPVPSARRGARPVRGFAFLALLLAAASPAAAVTLKIATLSPEGSPWMEQLEAAADEVARATGDRVRLRFYAGGVMGGDEAMLRKMRIGQLHGAAITGGSLSEIASEALLYSLPLLFEDLDEVDRVRARFDGRLIEALGREGYAVLGIAGAGFAFAMSRDPVRTLPEMRERRLWAPDRDAGALASIRAFDVTPVPLALADVRVGLQSGLVDAVIAPPIGALALQWHTQVDHVLELPLLYVYGLLLLDADVLDRLRPGDRAILRSVVGGAFERVQRDNRASSRAAWEALTGSGVTPVAPDPVAERAWRRAGREARARLVAEGVVRARDVAELRAILGRPEP